MNERRSFNENLIEGLWKMRNTRPDTRDWLRQCIRLERKRRHPDYAPAGSIDLNAGFWGES